MANLFQEAAKLRRKNKKLTVPQSVKLAAKNARAKKKSSRKKVGAIKIVERGESKSARPSRTYQVNRTRKGTFKGYTRIGAVDIPAAKDGIKNKLAHDLGLAEYGLMRSTKKTDQKKWRKKIAELKSKLRNLGKI